MFKKWIYLAFSCILLSISTQVLAQPTSNSSSQAVIENWFSAMKNQYIDKAGSFLAPQFMSIHTDGIVRNKTQEMQLIKDLKMKAYHLTNFQFSSSGDVTVVTFKDTGSEQIDNQPISTKPAGRMAVLQKQGDSWLILAYSNLDRIK